MVWAGIKRGDSVIVVHTRTLSNDRERRGVLVGAISWQTPGRAVAVGRTWITVEVGKGRPKRQRFQACDGRGEYGARVHTAQSLADEPRREKALARFRRTVWNHLPLATLEAVLRVAGQADDL